ncbi:MAG TPA: DNA-processing protein DprA [Spirochaetota bacterium]|nr:DNA-processing protein DprA [Spirochaetota bacterium]
MDDTLYWIFLSILSSPSKLGLYERVHLPPKEICNTLDIDSLTVPEYIAASYGCEPWSAASEIYQTCKKKNFKVVTFSDKNYPLLLKEIHKPPLVLYLQGANLQLPMVSIVGTRNSDKVSESIAFKIAYGVAKAGYGIVSGMAYGIDRFAHLGALKAEGATVGVLPGGIDTTYPQRNRDLYHMISISESSCLVSEYPPGIVAGQKWCFAQRNRIISGLSVATIVVKAPLDSGAMMTARYAIEQNRELLVCPGNAFDKGYSGCLELIKEGAALVSDFDDIMEILKSYSNSSGDSCSFEAVTAKETVCAESENGDFLKSVDLSKYSKVESLILSHLSKGDFDIDDFIRSFSLGTDEVTRAIVSLEIEGIILRKGNRIFRKKSF